MPILTTISVENKLSGVKLLVTAEPEYIYTHLILAPYFIIHLKKLNQIHKSQKFKVVVSSAFDLFAICYYNRHYNIKA